MATMGRLQFGRLSQAWPGEASDFTPLLSERLDQLGAAIGVDLASVGRSEVPTDGGRRIDIVAQDTEGAEIVIENQFGRADHDHLTRGLAYAVAARARGLVVVAEEHRDEFRAVARYLNDLREAAPERAGIAVWLVEARAVRVDESAWAPMFVVVVEPNEFVASVEQARPSEARPLSTLEDLWAMCDDEAVRTAIAKTVEGWIALGYRRRLGPNRVVLEAPGPAASGIRALVALYADGRVQVPFASYAGMNSGIEVAALATPEFRAAADSLFGFNGSEQQARTTAGWLVPERVSEVMAFATEVATAYERASALAQLR